MLSRAFAVMRRFSSAAVATVTGRASPPRLRSRARWRPSARAAPLSPRISLHRALDREPSHLVGRLRHRRLHACPPSIALRASSSASKPMTRILPVRPAAAIASTRAERHQVAAREDRVDVAVRLQHVLEDGEALVALPVRGLRGDDRDARRRCRSRRGSRAAASRRSRGRECPRGSPTLALPPVASTRYSPREPARPRSCRSR